MPGAMPIRGPPGQTPRASTGIRGPMGRGDYGTYKDGKIFHTMILCSLKHNMVLSLLVSQVTILLC